MSSTSSRYRIVCSCGNDVIVGPGRAGGQVPCGRCGTLVAVPRLRDLEPFVIATAAQAPRRWRGWQGWLLVGLVVAALAAVAAISVPLWLSAGPALLADEATIRATIESIDAATAYQAWQAMRISGVDRGTLPEELRLQQAAGAAARVALVFWTVVGAGLITAAAAGAASLLDRGRHPRVAAKDPTA